MLLEVLAMREIQDLAQLAATAVEAGASGAVRLAAMLGRE